MKFQILNILICLFSGLVFIIIIIGQVIRSKKSDFKYV